MKKHLRYERLVFSYISGLHKYIYIYIFFFPSFLLYSVTFWKGNLHWVWGRPLQRPVGLGQIPRLRWTVPCVGGRTCSHEQPQTLLADFSTTRCLVTSQFCCFRREIISLSRPVLMSEPSVSCHPPLPFPFSSRFAPLTFLYTPCCFSPFEHGTSACPIFACSLKFCIFSFEKCFFFLM